MEIDSVNTKANAGLTTGIIGTSLAGLLTLGGLGAVHSGYLNNNGSNGSSYVTKDELKMAQELAAKDSQIALLTSEQNTEIKIADVYERIMTRVNSDARSQAEWNASQSVINAQMSAAIATNTNSITALQNTCSQITKTIVPITAVCPEPMKAYNSWTAPTATTSGGGTQ